MLLIPRFLKLIGIIICAILLSQCTNAIEASTPPSAAVNIVNQPVVSPYSMPATAYLALAKNQTDDEKQALLIKAAGRLILDGQWQEGLAILSQTRELSVELTNEKSLLLAKIDLIREHPRAAITKLAAVREINRLSIYYQVQFHEMLASAYQSVGNTTESVVERIKLDKFLPDEASKSKNRHALWLALTRLPTAELNTLAAEYTDNASLEGWIQLALISRRHDDNGQTMLAQVEQWQAHFPEHPGNYILPSPLASVSESLFAAPKRIALLLPLTGSLAGPGSAVKEGFMAGFRAKNSSDAVKVDFYNTDAANVAALYLQAIADGADYVVGPLSKTDVAIVAKMNHPVPTLLLNDVDVRPNDRAYQFGLSPSNEARQIAIKMQQNGYARALVISPTGDWGNEVVAAFTDQWRAHGGRIVDTLHYGQNDDMNDVMRHFLHISESEARGKRLKELLGQHIESTPSRRQDFDVIFLLAYSSKARQIMPLLKYYYAGDVPVYATSVVYAGGINTMRDRDLEGIIFCDMPWVFTHQMSNKNWPEQFNSYSRLYALGLDSYALSTQLNQLLLFPAMGVSDKNGALYLNSSQQIARTPAWGQFKQGLARQSC